MQRHTVDADVTVLASAAELPGLGHLPVNCFVLHAEQPVLVDTGMPAYRSQLLEHLWSSLTYRRRWPMRWRTSEECHDDRVHRRLRKLSAVR